MNRQSRGLALILLLAVCLAETCHAFVTTLSPWTTSKQCRRHTLVQINMAKSFQQRENEIRRKILKLKRQGKIKKTESSSSLEMDKIQRRNKTSASDDYSQKLKTKLGKKKASLMGLTNSKEEEEYDEYDEIQAELDSCDQEELVGEEERKGQLGSLPRRETPSDDSDVVSSTTDTTATTTTSPSSTPSKPVINPDLFNYKDEVPVEEPDEQDLVQLVAQKLQEKRAKEQQDEEEKRQERLAALYEEKKKTSSGVGGSWTKTNTTKVETYQPKTGSWGAFPRPKDISKAYGGGRRVGAGFDETQLVASQQDTRERLRQYREKVGIEVQSEKDHASEIDEALRLGGYAMQRGMYSTAVKCLEKVTKYCSTNSRVGGKVFLELAMAYEAEGRTQEAVTVYRTLSESRIEEIKFDAKRLLYGIEAMQFMRNEARSEAFSRKKIRNTFIDTTGLDHIAENFEDRYETAYVDLSRGFYKKLTESVVRSNREARQILLQATGSGTVEHLKIVQALRSISRHFDTALEDELKAAAPQSVAVMNGKPIVQQRESSSESSSVATVMAGMDEYVLASPEQMMEMLNGVWRLQLKADRQGDGVKFSGNSTFQIIDMDAMTFTFKDPSGFVKISQSGSLEFQDEKRILTKTKVNTSGGGMLSGLMGGKSSSQTAAQQVVLVDSTVLVTRLAFDKKRSTADTSKGYFSVWRRVGTPGYMEESELELSEPA